MKFEPTAVRASELARCARMAAIRGTGQFAIEDHDEQTRRYFARGHLYSDYVCRQLEQKHGKHNVQRELPIKWPLGEGHADAYVIPEKLIVEIKSTVTPSTSSPMFDMSVKQTKIYIRFHPEATHGALYLINPSDLSGEEVFAVSLTDEDIDEIDDAVRAVAAAIGGAELPPRVCTRPQQARGRLCPFADPCFAGWEPPPAGLSTEPDLVEAAALVWALNGIARPLKAELKDIGERLKKAKSLLAESVEEGKTVIGGYEVRRTHVKKAPTFSEKLATAAGFPVHALEEFMRAGAEYDTVTVKRADQPGDIDFGEEPPF